MSWSLELRSGLCDDKPKKAPLKNETEQSEDLCKQARDVDVLAKWAAAYATSPGTLYRYEIENRGTNTARQIRLAGEDIASLQIERGRKSADIQESPDGEFYQLPDLNPRETATVLVWMTSHADQDLMDYNPPPAVTFAGPSVSTTTWRLVPEAWWNLYDLFGTLPMFLLIIVVIAISLLITLALVLVLSIADALIRGKPLRSVFQQPPKSNAGE